MDINRGLVSLTVTGHTDGDAHQYCSDSRQPTYELSELVEQFLAYMLSYRQASPLTVEAYRRDLRRLAEFLRGSRLPTEVREIDTRHIQAFAISMSELALATIRRALNAISSFFGYLMRTGIVNDNPVNSVVKPKAKPRKLRMPPTTECRRMVAACKDSRSRAMLLLLLTAGLRRAELLDLRTGDVAADSSEVTVVGKDDKTRTIPLPDQTSQALHEHLAQRDDQSDLLFTNQAVNRVGNTTFARWFRRILRRAGLEDSGI